MTILQNVMKGVESYRCCLGCLVEVDCVVNRWMGNCTLQIGQHQCAQILTARRLSHPYLQMMEKFDAAYIPVL